MIWHVWDLHNDTADTCSVTDNLDRRVDIMRKTTLFDGRHPATGIDPPIREWDLLKDELANRIVDSGPASDTERLEDACWEILSPVLLQPANAESRLAALQERPYSCWVYKTSDASPQLVDLHFDNAYQPESPFKTRRTDLIESLHRLLTDVQVANPAASQITCGSWLNQFAPFQSIFPQSWAESFVPVYDYWGTYGWWGQYMTSSGGYHEHNGDSFRANRQHPYIAGSAGCGLDEAMAHLRTLL